MGSDTSSDPHGAPKCSASEGPTTLGIGAHSGGGNCCRTGVMKAASPLVSPERKRSHMGSPDQASMSRHRQSDRVWFDIASLESK